MAHNRIHSLAHALRGFAVAWREEANFRIQAAIAVVALALAWYLHISLFEFAAISFAIGIVLTAELFNTAFEELCDKYSTTHDPHIGKIKDLAAAAVLVSSLTAAIVGAVIFLPHIFV